MENDEADMARCCCRNLNRCTATMKKLLEDGETIYNGCFTIRGSQSEKIKSFRQKLEYWLGVDKALSYLRVRKHHFAVDVLRYLEKSNQFITTPISKKEVIKNGLGDYVEYYRGNLYMFVPNISFEQGENNKCITEKEI